MFRGSPLRAYSDQLDISDNGQRLVAPLHGPHDAHDRQHQHTHAQNIPGEAQQAVEAVEDGGDRPRDGQQEALVQMAVRELVVLVTDDEGIFEIQTKNLSKLLPSHELHHHLLMTIKEKANRLGRFLPK